MLNDMEQTRMDKLIFLVIRMGYYTQEYKKVLKFIRSFDFRPIFDINDLKEIFEHKNYPEYMYKYENLDEMIETAKLFTPLLKDEIYYIMKADYDKGWIQITDENCEEITNQLNKEISVEIEAEKTTNEILKKIKNGG